MKSIFRFLLSTACLFVVALAFVAALFATFFAIGMLIVLFQEGRLQATDQRMLGQASIWLLSACALIGIASWLRRKILGKTADESFRLVNVNSGRSERVLQNFSDLILLVLLISWLWAITPGTAISKIPIVTGWSAIGFLGMHVRIALHEIGHLAAAWFLGLELRKIQVGVGPVLWSHSLANGLLSEWRTWPQGGFVFTTHRKTESFRARQSLVIGAGPLVDLVLLWSSYELITYAFGGLSKAFLQGGLGVIIAALFWWTALSTVGGLIPHKRWLDCQRVWTDGYWLLRLWTGSAAFIAELARNSNWRELLELLKSDPLRNTLSPDAAGRSLHSQLVNLVAFDEQRLLLSSRLLRRPTSTSSLPASP